MKTDDPGDAGVQGAQTVDRACRLLREIALAGPGGARMLDLCESCGLSRPTVHRILRSLQAADLVVQDSRRRYSLGAGLFELGLAVPNPIKHFPQVRDVIDELAARTDDTVYLMLRSHEDVVCAWRAQGGYHIKANVVALGDRRPISASVAGLALLGSLPVSMAAEIISANRPYLPDRCSLSFAEVQEHVERCRSAGYVVGIGAVMDGVTAVGVAVPSSYERPFLALSVSAISSRIPPERIPQLVSELRLAAKKISGLTSLDQT